MEEIYFKRVTVLLLYGWDVIRVSLYDEEGVEGWRWEDPGGNDYCEIGDWNDLPEMPEEVELRADELIKQRGIW